VPNNLETHISSIGVNFCNILRETQETAISGPVPSLDHVSDGSIVTTQLGPWTVALAARPKMWVCNSRTPSQPFLQKVDPCFRRPHYRFGGMNLASMLSGNARPPQRPRIYEVRSLVFVAVSLETFG
jgi:hypothetical protein